MNRQFHTFLQKPRSMKFADVMQPVRRTAASVCDGLLQIAYPPTCLGCGARLPGNDLPLCVRCVHHLDRPTPDDIEERLLRRPEAAEELDDVFALWLFDKGGVLQQVQHRIKYGNRPRHGVACGRLMGRSYAGEGDRTAYPEVVVPIPLHRARLLERGYNQSEMLSLGLASVLRAEVRAHVLARPRATRSQTGLAHDARWPNVRGAFSVRDPQSIACQRILLVDDVMTTGSTAAAAAAVLRAAGAAAVSLAVLALAR